MSPLEKITNMAYFIENILEIHWKIHWESIRNPAGIRPASGQNPAGIRPASVRISGRLLYSSKNILGASSKKILGASSKVTSPKSIFWHFHFFGCLTSFNRSKSKTTDSVSHYFSLRIRHFNLEPRISQQMLTYKQNSIFVEKGDGSQVKFLTCSVFWMFDLV